MVIEDLKTGQVEELYPGAAIIFIGLDPYTGFVKDDVELDRLGFLTTAENMQTRVEGVLAAEGSCGEHQTGGQRGRRRRDGRADR